MAIRMSEQTGKLIQQLTAELRPVRADALPRSLAASLLVGAAIALLLLCVAVGLRSDLSTAIHTVPFWMKWLYVGSLSIVGFALCLRLARPDGAVGKLLWWFAVPIGVLALRAGYELQQAPAFAIHRLWMGHSALVCPWNIAALAAPVFISVVWILRRLAPTHLRLAGFAAGWLSGASGAVVYALYCNESAAPFILVWYSIGMLLPAALGAVLGPRLLRW